MAERKSQTPRPAIVGRGARVGLFSNPMARALAILDFLVANPDRAFGLRDLARRLHLNRSTCLAILTTLTRSGYLFQEPQSRAYRLGPSLVAAGAAAAAQFPMLDEIKREMLPLCTRLNFWGTAWARAHDQLVVVARLSYPDPINDLVQTGLRVPFAAPIGCALIAWSSRSELDDWFERAQAEGGASERQERALQKRILHSMSCIRSRGFEVTLRTVAERNLLATLRSVRRRSDTPDLKTLARKLAVELKSGPYHLDDIAAQRRYPVSAITVPVFGGRSQPELQLMIGGFRRDPSGSEIQDAAGQLLDVACRVSTASGGHLPPLFPRAHTPLGKVSRTATARS